MRLQARINYLNSRDNESAVDKVHEKEGIDQAKAWLEPFIKTNKHLYEKHFTHRAIKRTYINKPKSVYLTHAPLSQSALKKPKKVKSKRARRIQKKNAHLQFKGSGLFVDLAYHALDKLNQIMHTSSSPMATMTDAQTLLKIERKKCDAILKHTIKHIDLKQGHFDKNDLNAIDAAESVAHDVLTNFYTVLAIQEKCDTWMAKNGQNPRPKLLLAPASHKTQDEKATAGLRQQPIASAALVEQKPPKKKTHKSRTISGIMPHPAGQQARKPKTIRQKLRNHERTFLAMFSDQPAHYTIRYKDLVGLVRAAGGHVETCGQTAGCRRRIVLNGKWSTIKQGGIHAPYSTGRGNQCVGANVVLLFRCAFDRAGITPKTLGLTTPQSAIKTSKPTNVGQPSIRK